MRGPLHRRDDPADPDDDAVRLVVPARARAATRNDRGADHQVAETTRRDGDDRITLSVEHRAAPAIPALSLELVQRVDALALEVIHRTDHAPQPGAPQSIDDRIAAALADAGQPQPFADLRALCRVRTAPSTSASPP